jgi:cell division protein FtsL
MTLIRQYNIIIFLCFCVIASGVSLVVVSQKSYETQKRVKTSSQDIQQKYSEIKALEAELAYLTRPARIAEIAAAIPEKQVLNTPSNPVTPVSFSQFETMHDMQSAHSVRPRAKPIYQASFRAKPKAPEIQTPTPARTKNEVKTNDFSSLLDKIGG